MSKVSSSNTKPEILVRKFLFGCGMRYRLHNKKLPGKPDINLAKYKTIIFIHGCFWHCHENCEAARLPKTNLDYWKHKIDSNTKRDHINADKLISMGWKIIIVWECELKNAVLRTERLNNLIYEIKK